MRLDEPEEEVTHILVSQVLEQLQLAISSLTQNGGGKGLHDFLDGDRGARELVFCRAAGDKRLLRNQVNGPLTKQDQRLPYRQVEDRHNA